VNREFWKEVAQNGIGGFLAALVVALLPMSNGWWANTPIRTSDYSQPIDYSQLLAPSNKSRTSPGVSNDVSPYVPRRRGAYDATYSGAYDVTYGGGR
jgi:hypothetical protein